VISSAFLLMEIVVPDHQPGSSQKSASAASWTKAGLNSPLRKISADVSSDSARRIVASMVNQLASDGTGDAMSLMVAAMVVRAVVRWVWAACPIMECLKDPASHAVTRLWICPSP